jgi:hypothetical protein
VADPIVYDIGDEIVLTGTFKNRAGQLTNPTAVVCKVRKPDGTTATLSTTNPSTGVFEAVLDIVLAGEHWFRFTGTGAVKAAAEQSFSVRSQQVP